MDSIEFKASAQTPTQSEEPGLSERRLGADRRRARQRDGRRFLNVFVAVLGIVLTVPLMVLVAIAIKLTSRGPVIYRQHRVGLNRRKKGSNPDICRRSSNMGGNIFTIYKFRTMTDSGAAAKQVWAQKNDARVTAIGKFLRKTRIDELPQLFNVLKGDMNVVGPRPEQPQIFVDLRSQVPGYDQRQGVVPGITGLAQINLSYDNSVEDVKRKVGYDLEYINRRCSASHDLRIMAMTIPVMVLRKGAQ